MVTEDLSNDFDSPVLWLFHLGSEFVCSEYKVQDFLLPIESWNGSPRTEVLSVEVCLNVQTLHFTHVTTGPIGDS